MDNNEGFVFACPRCGNDMNSTARYCMKCGYLNPSHPDNKQYVKLINKNGIQEYNVSGGTSSSTIKVNINEVSKGAVDITFGEHTGSFTLCFIINFLFFLLLLISSVVGYYMLYSGNITSILSSELCYILFGIALYELYFYSVQLVYMKITISNG